jgi:preprotein translocase subunit YajC
MFSSKASLLAICFSLAVPAGAAFAQTAPAGEVQGEELKSAPKEAPPAGQAASAPAQQQQPTGQQPKRSLWEGQGLILIMLAFLVLLMVWTSRSKKRQETKQKEMLAALKKGDKVTSIGGVIGTVIEVRDDEVLVKVDETNNVRMRFARWAIKGTGESAKTQPPEEKR